MGFLKDAWTKAKDYGSKIYTTAKDVNSKFGDIISQGATALAKMPHVVPRTIGNVIIGAQKLLGKTQNFDELIDKGKDYAEGKAKELYSKMGGYTPSSPSVTPATGGVPPTGPPTQYVGGKGYVPSDMNKVLNGGSVIKRLFG